MALCLLSSLKYFSNHFLRTLSPHTSSALLPQQPHHLNPKYLLTKSLSTCVCMIYSYYILLLTLLVATSITKVEFKAELEAAKGLYRMACEKKVNNYESFQTIMAERLGPYVEIRNRALPNLIGGQGEVSHS
jgi:hypothetical protein